MEQEIKSQTGGLCLTNDVSSEDSRMHVILVWGFTAKGVNTYAIKTF